MESRLKQILRHMRPVDFTGFAMTILPLIGLLYIDVVFLKNCSWMIRLITGIAETTLMTMGVAAIVIIVERMEENSGSR